MPVIIQFKETGGTRQVRLLSSHLTAKPMKMKIYKTIIFPVDLYQYETWSPALREEHKKKCSRKYMDLKRLN
jgi:hypothetical protein